MKVELTEDEIMDLLVCIKCSMGIEKEIMEMDSLGKVTKQRSKEYYEKYEKLYVKLKSLL